MARLGVSHRPFSVSESLYQIDRKQVLTGKRVTLESRIRSEDERGKLTACKNGAPGEIRTPDHLVRSQVLYPAELRAHY